MPVLQRPTILQPAGMDDLGIKLGLDFFCLLVFRFLGLQGTLLIVLLRLLDALQLLTV